MWIAQWPDGTWILYKDKPREKMGGWDGDVYSVLIIHSDPISWRQTLREVSIYEYVARYRHKEVR